MRHLTPVLVMTAVACGIESPGRRSPPEEVASAILAADNRGDLDAVLSMHADSARLLPPGEPVVVGIDAIRDRYEGIFAASSLAVHGNVLGVRRTNDLAVVEGTVEGTVTAMASGEGLAVDDKYLMVLIWDARGRWVISQLAWSSNH